MLLRRILQPKMCISEAQDCNNPMQEFATEVTKIINDEVMQLGKELS